jgi:hypothetical protein
MNRTGDLLIANEDTLKLLVQPRQHFHRPPSPVTNLDRERTALVARVVKPDFLISAKSNLQ